MVNSTDILSAWTRIGWLEPSKTGYTSILDTDNKTTLSGKTFDALHPLTNFVRFKDTYPDSAATAGVLNAQLKAWQQTGIITVMEDVTRDQDFVNHGVLLSEDDFDLDDTIANSDKFVFVRVTVPYGYVLTVQSIGISLDTVDTFNVYIFNSTQKAYLTATEAITPVANAEKWTALTYKNLWGTTYSAPIMKSGVYYIGYFQTDIPTAKALQREYYPKSSPVRFEYCYATPNGTSCPEDETISTTGYTYGINLDYTISRDFTPIYIKSPQLFDKALGYYVIEQMIRQMLLTDRFNTSERKAKDVPPVSQLFTELNGQSETTGTPYKGVIQLYKDEVEKLKAVLFKKNQTGTMR